MKREASLAVFALITQFASINNAKLRMLGVYVLMRALHHLISTILHHSPRSQLIYCYYQTSSVERLLKWFPEG
jgi:hypothetical protein